MGRYGRHCDGCGCFCRSGSCTRCGRWNDGVVLVRVPFKPNYKLIRESLARSEKRERASR
jgi:hypothetical protein